MKRAKITIVGAGNVGANCAVWAAQRELGDIVLIDIPDFADKTAGKAPDLPQCGPVARFDANIVGTADYQHAKGSDVVIITAGLPRKPGMSRDDLIQTNVKIVKSVSEQVAKVAPEAVLVISAHWESEVFSVNARVDHELLFDYYGFPEHTYRLTWPVRGDATLSADVAALLQEVGVTVALEEERGLDHGVFIPLLLAYPDAEVPTVELSLVDTLDPALHLEMGRALAPLREDGRDVSYGGHVSDGVVFALEFRIECFDDIELRRADDEATGLQLWAEQKTRSSASAPTEGSSAWARRRASSTACA